ncbi:hypothetical protein FA15DRAFT_129219 [Coprinopsis marcescibilis]|uniref:Macrofage activating glycoprotein n=1 Tax=Coprinopsis marcescibilis TaxID=230819 RepID=A0A5C3KKH0_COPMA|nr:hypothetical protein FA15DRAFT_129219 [Coprinopsis marcescibilis]
MFTVARSISAVLVLGGAALVAAQDVTVPGAPTETYPSTAHASKTFAFADLPYKIDTDTHLIRGPQHGYNICNGTTENQESLCQTSHFNSLDDFCLWGPPDYGRTVGDIEGIMVAYCTKPGHGTRLIPEGALTGVQWITTPDYVQAVGFIDQTMINIVEGDWGGEMDPHGADLRGNPMGGIVFSDAWTGAPTQVIEWHLFIGGNRFCYKACDPRGQNDDRFCEHILDRIGCDFNIPNAAQDEVFESCLGDNQDFPGIYTENGVEMTYQQPEGSIPPLPYVARTPASSSCTQFESAALYTGLPQASDVPGVTRTGSGVSATITPSGSGGRPVSANPSRTNSGSGPNASGGAAGSGAFANAVSGFSVLGALLFSALFLA